MRVIAGTARGCKLLSLEGMDTRPTTDRVKESMFNIVMPYLAGAAALDLFAGSGALGIEALSRGAEKCTFVENGTEADKIIRQNLTHTKLMEKAVCIKGDAHSFLQSTRETYSIIFLDPPYDGDFYGEVLDTIQKRKLLQTEGVVVLEKRADLHIPLPAGWEVIKDRKYGKTAIWILTAERGNEND